MARVRAAGGAEYCIAVGYVLFPFCAVLTCKRVLAFFDKRRETDHCSTTFTVEIPTIQYCYSDWHVL